MLEPDARNVLDELCGRGWVPVADLISEWPAIKAACAAGYARRDGLTGETIGMTPPGRNALLADAEENRGKFNGAARWVLVAEFDGYEAARERGCDCPYSEAVMFWEKCRRYMYNGIPEDCDEAVKIEGDVVTLGADIIDCLNEPLTWLLFHAVPRRFEVRRNG